MHNRCQSYRPINRKDLLTPEGYGVCKTLRIMETNLPEIAGAKQISRRAVERRNGLSKESAADVLLLGRCNTVQSPFGGV